MKPEYLAVILAVIGGIINGAWTVHNIHVKSEVRRMVAELKEYVRHECVGREVFNEFYTEVMRRLTEIGA